MLAAKIAGAKQNIDFKHNLRITFLISQVKHMKKKTIATLNENCLPLV